MREVIVGVSGGFDPIHIGHIRMMQEARKLGTKLIVFVNGDEFLIRKKGRAFMNLEDRMEIVSEFSCVDEVVAVIDQDQTVCATLKKYRPHIFANGGDRFAENIPEAIVCRDLGIKTVFNVGRGGKVRSSSELLRDYHGFLSSLKEVV